MEKKGKQKEQKMETKPGEIKPKTESKAEFYDPLAGGSLRSQKSKYK